MVGDHATPRRIGGTIPRFVVHSAGADSRAAEIWAGGDLRVEAHPADWKTHGKKVGVFRNQAMVDLVCAFPVGRSVGTKDCITRARVARIPVWVFEAGSVKSVLIR